jgi:HlyD family secretion protein
LKAAEGEIALAESDLKRAEDRMEWSNKMYEKEYLSTAQNIADRLSLQKARFALEQAQTKKAVLEKYTYDKSIKELESELKKAHSVEIARKADWEREKQKTRAIRREIARCKIHAPADGELILGPGIERGAAVRERQLVFRVLTGDRPDFPR